MEEEKHIPQNVNQVHAEALSLNEQVALWVARHVGTMGFCYGLALVMLIWGLANIFMGTQAPDPYPFSFLFFCLGGIMQSLLMPLIMVAQNLNSRHQELQAEEQFKTTTKSYADVESILGHLSTLEGEVSRHSTILAAMAQMTSGEKKEV